MHNFCVVYCLAVALCFVVCVSGNAVVSKGDAETAVKNAQDTVKAVRGKAQSQIDSAKGLLAKVELYKNEAAKASSHADEVAPGNTAAEEIAIAIKSLSVAVEKLYPDPKEKLDTAVNSLTTMLAEVQVLEGQSPIKILPNKGTEDDFTDTKGKATELKGEADALDNRINDAIQQFNGLDATAREMENKAIDAQIKDSQVSAIVAVAKIVGMLGKADDIIRQIEVKKNTVNGIVDEMKTLKTNPPVVPDENINALLQGAEYALRDATGAVESAQSAKVEMTKQKELANTALTNVKGENQEVSEAQEAVSKAEAYVSAAGQSVQKLDTALQTADNSLRRATDFKQQLQTALSKATSNPGTEQSVTNPQIKTLQDSVTAVVSAIQTMMQEAEGTLQRTQNHKEEVNNIVEEMKKHCTTDLIESYEIIKEQCQSANDALTSAKGAVEKAKSAKGEIEQQKGLADTALKMFKNPKQMSPKQNRRTKRLRNALPLLSRNLRR